MPPDGKLLTLELLRTIEVHGWDAMEMGYYKVEDGSIITNFHSAGDVRYSIPGIGYHRIGGPAIFDYKGNEIWYENNRIHRIGGPAKSSPSLKLIEWWINGIKLGDGPVMPRKYKHVMDKWLNLQV